MEKFKSILNRELTYKETAFVVVFFFAIFFYFQFDSQSDSKVETPKIVESPKIPREKSKREIIRAEFSNPKIDPFSKDHFTREKISELKSKSEIEDTIEDEVKIPTVEKKSIEQPVEKSVEKILEETPVAIENRAPIKLKGIIFADEKSIAIVDFNGEKDLSIGDSIDNSKIVEIARNFIVLDSGEKFFIDISE